MVYVKETFKYMFRAFFVLALVCLPAAVLLGIFSKPMATLSYLVSYSDIFVRSFKDVFWMFFNRYATVYFYPLVLIFLSLVFCVSLALSVVEKHFRIGKLMLKAPLRQINNYVIPVLLTFTILSLIMVLYGLVQTGLLTLLHMIVSGKGYPNALTMVLAVMVSLTLFVLVVFVSCSIMYWTPMMVIYGFSFRDAAAASLRLIDHKTGSVLFGVLLPFLIVAILQSLFSFIANVYVGCALGAVLYLFLIMYLVCYIMVSMFDLSDMERRDKKTVW